MAGRDGAGDGAGAPGAAEAVTVVGGAARDTAHGRTLVSLDGALLEPSEARVSVFDRGFLYGDSVFETLRTYGGVPFCLDEHLTRLESSAERVALPLPVPRETLRTELLDAVAAAGNAESYVRLMLTRGSGALGLAPPTDARPLRLVIVGPLHPPPLAHYEHGIAVVTHRTQRLTDGSDAAGAKIANYLVSVLAMRDAAAAGASEALIVDREGRVLEGATSNVFGWLDGCWRTAPVESGVLAGITRARLLELLAARGEPVQQRALTLAELTRVEELFVSSSIRELLPVVRVDGAPVGDGKPGARTRALLSAFRASVRVG